MTYDEVLDVVHRIELEHPVIGEPDWPVQGPSAFPASVAPLIIPTFDTMQSIDTLKPGMLAVRELSWGFEESWKPGVIFNTRIESAAKPLWQDSMEHRRCVIPVTSFFETHREETVPSPKTGRPIKRSYEFEVPGQDVVLIGGLWRDDRFSMVTTQANAAMAPIHHRMPLVLRQQELPLWLGPNYHALADRSSVPLVAHPTDPALW